LIVVDAAFIDTEETEL
jgi:hypothetical protein